MADGSHPPPGRVPRWPERLRELAAHQFTADGATRRDQIRAEMWTILISALTLFCRGHASRMPTITEDQIRDLAAEKTLDLLQKLESRKWDMAGRSPEEISAYLSGVARNGLGRLIRGEIKERTLGREIQEEREVWRRDRFQGRSPGVSAADLVESREFARDLLACLLKLKPRDGRIWFLRAMLEMSSKEVAARQDISLNPAHLDVVYSRSRAALGQCMREKGHVSQVPVPGTFAILWTEFWNSQRRQENE